MTLEIPEKEWNRFFDDLSRRRFEWRSKIEVISDSIGSQILSEDLPLVGITVEEKNGAKVIEIAVGEETAQHQTHNIDNPSKIAFLSDEDNIGGIVEIEEDDGTKTLIHIIEPMPLIFGYTEFEVVSAVV